MSIVDTLSISLNVALTNFFITMYCLMENIKEMELHVLALQLPNNFIVNNKYALSKLHARDILDGFYI